MTTELALAPRRVLFRTRREAIVSFFVAVLLPLFFIREPTWLSFNWIAVLSNLGHIVFFALLTLLTHSRYPLRKLRHWLAVTAIILLLSIAIELIQGQVGRTASMADIARNLLGTWLVIFWQMTSSPATWVGRLAVSTLLGMELLLISSAGLTLYRVSTQLPILSNVEAAADMQQWRSLNSLLSRSNVIRSEGNYALRAALLPGDFSGMILSRFPHNWQHYSQLRFDLYNAQNETLTITLRIHDRQHERGGNAWRYADRFNRSLQLEPGWNAIVVNLGEIEAAPTQRSMNLNQMRELQLFVTDSKKPKVIYVDNLRLAQD